MTEINLHFRIGQVKYKNVIESAHPGRGTRWGPLFLLREAARDGHHD